MIKETIHCFSVVASMVAGALRTWDCRAILEGNKNLEVLQVIRNPELLADRSATLHKRELK